MMSMLVGGALALAGGNSAVSPCEVALAMPRSPSGSQVQAQDLLALLEIGGATDAQAPFSISPDGNTIAIAVRQAVPDTNSYCTHIMLIDRASGKATPLIEVRGKVALIKYDWGPLTDFSSGTVKTVVPKWSPDGRKLAYLEEHGGVVQLMLYDLSDGQSRQISQVESDILEFEWRDGAIRYSSRSGAMAAAAAIEAEGLKGFRYDERWNPNWQARPFPAATPIRYFSLDPATGETRALPAEKDDSDDGEIARADKGGIAKIAATEPEFINSKKQINLSGYDMAVRSCDDVVCQNALKIWWRPGSDKFLFLRRAGWGDSLTQIVQIDAHTMGTKVLLETEDNVSGCHAADSDLICAVDGAMQPKRLEAIDYSTGARRVLFDPNPQWANLRKGPVRLLRWRNERGLEIYGRLVLPSKVSKTAKLPLVVVGYSARGFLKAGTGDLYPVLPLASEGIAVLVYTLPAYVGYEKPARDQTEADHRAYADLSEPKSEVSAIRAGIDLVVNEGLVDRERIGLTGFSAGVMAGVYALRWGVKFKAVSFASCCTDPFIRETMLGPFLGKRARDIGWPALSYEGAPRKEDYGLAPVAKEMDAPLLVQSGDREYLLNLETEAALRRQGKTIETYIYPDEYHVLWQPAHRQAVYARNLAWFDRYLLGRENSWALKTLEKPAQSDQ